MKKKSPYSNPYIRAIIWPRFRSEFLEAFRLRAKFFNDAYLVDGVPHWKSNNQIPPKDILEFWEYSCLPFNFEQSEIARDKETTRFLAEYRESMRNYVPSDEELFEMRAAFGPGETVVNVITGQVTKL
jgi:hypothetical protein